MLLPLVLFIRGEAGIMTVIGIHPMSRPFSRVPTMVRPRIAMQ